MRRQSCIILANFIRIHCIKYAHFSSPLLFTLYYKLYWNQFEFRNVISMGRRKLIINYFIVCTFCQIADLSYNNLSHYSPRASPSRIISTFLCGYLRRYSLENSDKNYFISLLRSDMLSAKGKPSADHSNTAFYQLLYWHDINRAKNGSRAHNSSHVYFIWCL